MIPPWISLIFPTIRAPFEVSTTSAERRSAQKAARQMLVGRGAVAVFIGWSEGWRGVVCAHGMGRAPAIRHAVKRRVRVPLAHRAHSARRLSRLYMRGRRRLPRGEPDPMLPAVQRPPLLVADRWRDFQLIDCGDGMKQERWGPY